MYDWGPDSFVQTRDAFASNLCPCLFGRWTHRTFAFALRSLLRRPYQGKLCKILFIQDGTLFENKAKKSHFGRAKRAYFIQWFLSMSIISKWDFFCDFFKHCSQVSLIQRFNEFMIFLVTDFSINGPQKIWSLNAFFFGNFFQRLSSLDGSSTIGRSSSLSQEKQGIIQDTGEAYLSHEESKYRVIQTVW